MDCTTNWSVWSVSILPVMDWQSTYVWWVQIPGVYLFHGKNYGEEEVGMSITKLFLDISSYDSSFLEISLIWLGVGMVVSMFLKGIFG